MYDYIEGDLVSKAPTQAVIAAGGIGYSLTIPISTFDLLPDPGRPTRLYVYLHVREDLLRLYGFSDEDARRLFLQLIGVSGVGPQTALAVLSGMSVEDFRHAVASEELGQLTRIKGIGRKTAERIVLELKQQMERELAERPTTTGKRPAAPAYSDAVGAMLALGYTRSASEAAVAAALDKLGRAAPIEQLVREALRRV